MNFQIITDFCCDFTEAEYSVQNVHIGYVGPILGAHTGPGVLGLFHLGKER